MSKQRLAIQAWTLVKEYAGIYHIPDMDYALFKKKDFRRMKSGRIETYFPYVQQKYIELCNPPECFTTVRSSMFKGLSQGYKSKQFYMKMKEVMMPPTSTNPWKCLCGVEVYNAYDKEHHLRTVDHILAFKTNKFDRALIKEYKKDPALFEHLECCGFRIGSRHPFSPPRCKLHLVTDFNYTKNHMLFHNVAT